MKFMFGEAYLNTYVRTHVTFGLILRDCIVSTHCTEIFLNVKMSTQECGPLSVAMQQLM